MSELRFDDITPIEEKVILGGVVYLLRETTGDAYVKYDNARLSRYEYKDGLLAQIRDLADMEPLLVSLCMFMEDGTTPVSEAMIRGWPAKVQRALFARVKELSGMDIVESVKSLEEQVEELQKQIVKAKEAEDLPKS